MSTIHNPSTVTSVQIGNIVYQSAGGSGIAAALGIPEWAMASPLPDPHDVQRATDMALESPEADFPARVQQVLDVCPVHALAVLEVSSAERLGSLGVETIAALMRQEETDLRLAAMSVLGRRGRGAEPAEDLGRSESLELRKARRYVRARWEGPVRQDPVDLSSVYEGEEVLDQETICENCGRLFVYAHRRTKDAWESPLNHALHDCEESYPGAGYWFGSLGWAKSPTYRPAVLVGEGTKKSEPLVYQSMRMERDRWRAELESMNLKFNINVPVIDPFLRTPRFPSVNMVSCWVGSSYYVPPSQPRKGFRVPKGTRQAEPENEPWPAKVRGSWRLDQRKSKK